MLQWFLWAVGPYSSGLFRCKCLVIMKVLVQVIGCWKSFLSRGRREFSFPLKVPTIKVDDYTFDLQAVSHKEAHWDLKTLVSNSDCGNQWPLVASRNFCKILTLHLNIE